MKTKRSLLSVVIFLITFIITGIFNLQDPFIVAHDNRYSNESQVVINENKNDEEREDASVISHFSSENLNSEIYSYGSLLYLLPREAEAYHTDFDISLLSNNLSDENFITNSMSLESNDNITSMAFNILTDDTTDDKSSLEEEEFLQKPETPLYSNIAISTANSFVNIREKASPESTSLGKLYRDSAATIIETDGEWCYVESGSVKGYVKSEYLKTGIPDEELITNYGTIRIQVAVNGLNVRHEPDVDAKKLTVVYLGETYPAIELQDEWIKIEVKDDKNIGFVARDHVNLIVDFKKAISNKEEEEIRRLQEEEKAKKETAVKYREESSYSQSDLKLLACLVHAEAGNQSYEGKLAVANIVLNRVKSKSFPNNIRDVIYQKGQFTVASSGSLAKQLDRYENYSTESQRLTIKAAKEALTGANNIGSRLYFHSYQAAKRKGYDKKPSSVKLEDHLFWQ